MFILETAGASEGLMKVISTDKRILLDNQNQNMDSKVEVTSNSKNKEEKRVLGGVLL